MTSNAFAIWLKDWHLALENLAIDSGSLSEGAERQLAFIHQHSPYLASLLMKHPDVFLDFIHKPIDQNWQHIARELDKPYRDFSSNEALGKHLRIIKQRAALLIALADINESWPLKSITFALSHIAETSVERCLEFLLAKAAASGDIAIEYPDLPTMNSGLIVLGMGKLGAYELNYSSDIDLIVFYESGTLNYQGRHTEQHFLNKLVQDMAGLMQDRTADGYVFRTDLRLRPDPSSTPLAVSTDAALQYYESLGQNWERAAMIKARPIAGDMDTGERILTALQPYIWRKNLDFASIQDILSIKRQISKKVGVQEQLAGHNIKLGKGGIREIEFFVQLHQLIWGGRQKELRGHQTLTMLDVLLDLEHISLADSELLAEAYEFYRKLEHRLQMVADQQTHTLPEDDEAYEQLAQFMGFDSVLSFNVVLTDYIQRVHDLFIESFDSEGLHAEGNLVFTGDSHDPETLETLKKMGFQLPETISQTIMDWHRGSRRCTRSKTARQLLTELVPDILIALSNTVQPDDAFIKFDAFLSELPVGLQLFSLITQNPNVLPLIADVMGSSPALSKILSRRPELVETALFSGFYEKLPDKNELEESLEKELELIEYYEGRMELLRKFKNERQFQAGIQLLRSFTSADLVGTYLTDLADVLIGAALRITLEEFEQQYGTLEGSQCCIIALGKLGSRELTFNSDLDLMFVYDCQADAVSTGNNSHSPSVYYNRLCHRIISALTAIGSNGALYEVDTRLRPSGEQGLLAVSKEALKQYFSKDAWTFERMALCKARAIAGDAGLMDEVTGQIRAILSEPRDRQQLLEDVTTMRNKVDDEYGTDNIWDVKHAQGGLMDIDFAAEYILLAAASEFPELLTQRSRDILQVAKDSPKILKAMGLEVQTLETLIHSSKFLVRLQHMLRLTSEDDKVLNNPPAGLAEALTRYMRQESYEELIKELERVEKSTRAAYVEIK